MKSMARPGWLFLMAFFLSVVLGAGPAGGADIIIDNGDPGTSYTGTWASSSATNPYGIDSRWSRDGATYSWSFTPSAGGSYEVSMWWTAYTSRSSSIPVDIQHAGGTTRVTINQLQNGGKWNVLGTYAFVAGQSYKVTITSQPGPSSTCADAVRFAPSSGPVGNTAPVAVIDSISPNPALPGEVVSFSGHGTDSDGTIAGYSWQSSISGALSSLATFSTASLVTGSHTISFRVQDNNDAWSTAATRLLVVGSAPGPSEAIIDNGGAGTSYTGSWGVSGAANPYGSSSLWSRDGATYSWSFTPSAGGNYEVSMWWTAYTSRSSSIPVDIQHAGGTTRVTINQLQNGGKWNVLGTYAFVAGQSYKVTITSQPGPSSTCADAVRFAPSSGPVGNTAPVAVIDSISPNPALPGEVVSFSGHGTDSDGTIAGYSWQSSISGALSSLATFSTASLVTGSHTISFRVQDNNDAWSTAATRLLVVGSAPGPSEAIIDNGGAGTSYTGSWGVSGAANPYGSSSLWSRDGATYSWSFTPSAGGNYEVSMWWTAYTSRSSSIPVDIQHAGGTTRVTINQLQNGGKWNVLGTYAFVAGQSYKVTITSQPGPSSTCADAVRFAPSSGPVGNTAPVAVIDSISPNPALPGEVVSFSGHGTDSDGTIAGYSWRSSLDGLLGETATLATSALSSGNHTIYFKVKDDKAAWSAETGRTLTVQSQVSGGEHIYVCLLHDWEMVAKAKLIETLRAVGATQDGSVWKYVNSSTGKTFTIHIVEDMQGMLQALYTENAHIIIKGHANYGLGAVFPEASWPKIYDIYYIDDDKILNYSSPWIPVSISGMLDDQAYPNWWPIFRDGTSGIMPYDFDDSRGDPAYNYYAKYRVPGDPAYYKVETVRNSAIERFPDSGKPAWFSPDGAEPSPSNPDHLKYYITNLNNAFEPVGKWMRDNEIPGYFGSSYCAATAGSGAKHATWNFTIPAAGYYTVSAWWPASGSNTPGAPYTVTHASGSTTVRVDQRANGEAWNLLGEYYFGPGEYSVTLSDDVASGNIIADAIRISHRDDPAVLDRTMDNLNCPKTHYRSKVILFRKALEVDISRMKYSRMLFDICSSGVYLLDTFHRGLMFYTLNSSDGSGMYIYLKAYLQGRSNSEIWQLLQQVPAIYDYYDFSKKPSEQ